MMARLVRPIVSMRRRKLPPSSTPPAIASSSVRRARPGEGAHDGVLHVDQAAGVLGHQDERAVGQGEAEAGELAARVARVAGVSRSRTKSTTPSTGGMPGRLPTTTCCVGACTR